MGKVVRLKQEKDKSIGLKGLGRTVNEAQNQAISLNLKFLAYLLGLAKMEIATRLEEAER